MEWLVARVEFAPQSGCLARFGRLVGLLGLDMLNGRELIVHGLSAVLTC